MSQSDNHREIVRLNAEHPICASALAFLQGYVGEDSGSLHVISLLRCAYLNEALLRLPRHPGTPSPEEVESVINFLDRAKPHASLRYLTCIGGKEVLFAEELDQAESIEGAAQSVMEVLLSNLNLGATFEVGGVSSKLSSKL